MNPQSGGAFREFVSQTENPFHHFSGVVLRGARRAAVPKRVAHSHNDTSPSDRDAGPARHLYHKVMRREIERHCTVALAASGVAAVALYGPDWQADGREPIVPVARANVWKSARTRASEDALERPLYVFGQPVRPLVLLRPGGLLATGR